MRANEHRLHPEDSESPRVHLGPPLFPAKFYILDEDFNSAPIDVSDELYIGGSTINKDYLNRTELTKSTVLKASSLSDRMHEQSTLYRTRDSFRLTYDGTLKMLGRVVNDRQVKIRGIRIELEGIKNVIYQILRDPINLEINRASLVAVIYHEINDVNGILAVYLMTDDSIIRQNDNLLKACFRFEISRTLSVHMRPNAFIVLFDLPRTSSEKIDYQKMSSWPPPRPDSVNNDRMNLKFSLQSKIFGI